MAYDKHTALERPSTDSVDYDVPLLDNQPMPQRRYCSFTTRTGRYLIPVMICLFSLSAILNVLLLRHEWNVPRRNDMETSIAGLQRNIYRTRMDELRGLDDPIWDAPENQPEAGYVALDHDLVESMGWKRSQNWPWDPAKGIYILSSTHSMHCVYVFRDVIKQMRDKKKQLWSIEHMSHCLGILREDIKCAADDSLLYTGGTRVEEGVTKYLAPGVGDHQVCRNWTKLYEWSVANSACRQAIPDHWAPIPDRFKSCPNGNQPWVGKEPAQAHDTHSRRFSTMT